MRKLWCLFENRACLLCECPKLGLAILQKQQVRSIPRDLFFYIMYVFTDFAKYDRNCAFH